MIRRADSVVGPPHASDNPNAALVTFLVWAPRFHCKQLNVDFCQ